MVNERKLKVLSPKLKTKIKSLLQNIDESIDELYDIATIDEKTGLYNTKFFNSVFDIEFNEAKRGQKLSLLIIDIDFFKKLNDKYGHFTGDKILKQIAGILKQQTRKSDIIARFGGEEFLILFPNTKVKKAWLVAERIRKTIEKKLKKYKVTISGGLTENKKTDTKAKLKNRADKALYRAKDKGRNNIQIY